LQIAATIKELILSVCNQDDIHDFHVLMLLMMINIFIKRIFDGTGYLFEAENLNSFSYFSKGRNVV
jgi:hypothetical protein